MKKKKKAKGIDTWLAPLSFDPGSLMPRRLFDIPSRYFDLFSNSTPYVDLVDEGDSIRINADLPGVKKGDVKVSVNRDNVIIKASTKKGREEKGKNYYYNERSAAGYYRKISLPSDVNPKTTKAKLEDGILEIRIQKAKDTGQEVAVE